VRYCLIITNDLGYVSGKGVMILVIFVSHKGQVHQCLAMPICIILKTNTHGLVCTEIIPIPLETWTADSVVFYSQQSRVYKSDHLASCRRSVVLRHRRRRREYNGKRNRQASIDREGLGRPGE
jgi:hypothetical protein